MGLSILNPATLLLPALLLSSASATCRAEVGKTAGMSILFTTDSFYPTKGGGDLSLRALMRGLADKGYRVAVAYFGKDEDPEFESCVLTYPPLLRGFWPRHLIVRRTLKHHLKRVIREMHPDVVITQQIATSSTVDICKELGLPVIVLLRGVDFLCLGSYESGTEHICSRRCIGCKDVGERLLQFPFFRIEIRRIERSLRKADVVIANSAYTRSAFKEVLGLDSMVLNPPLAESLGACRVRDDGAVLFVSPVAHKGVAVAIELAHHLADEDFIFVGSAKDSTKKMISEMKNIRYVPWIDDMSECYAAAKVVIVPSVIPEGYGRVCSEAISRGVPCIVSPVGALPETIGAAGDVVTDYRDAGAWIDAVNRYSSREYTRTKSEIAVQNASRFMDGGSYATSIEGIIKGLVPDRELGECRQLNGRD